jgi:hypothetical protein
MRFLEATATIRSAAAEVLIFSISGDGGNDAIAGGAGNDILTAGGGSVRFDISESGPSNVDTIVDYSASAGDLIDVSNLLDVNFGAGSVETDFVRLVQTGPDITVQVDTDGPAAGATWSDAVVLSNYGTAGVDLVNVYFASATHQLTI